MKSKSPFEDRTKVLEGVIATLGEHFDHFQILATWDDSGLSYCLKKGGGSMYARLGMANEFITDDKSKSQADHIAQVINNQGMPPTRPFREDEEGWTEEED